ncbi:alpha/beta fold hydrolase [Isoptericola aurantiacus]|uniref:alpha/beta fold hydrolase n=1 Tax=Isoptericola aurantiacus TaxID=3377839 RepID=UPI00383B3777
MAQTSSPHVLSGAPEPSPARAPDRTGVVVRDGVRIAYAVHGEGGPQGAEQPTVLLLPTWSIVPSRFWKGQVGYLSRHFRVVTFDGRGSGASDRPTGAAAYRNEEFAADALAVLDATGTRRAVAVGLSCAATWALHLAADHPDRVAGVVSLAAACGFAVPQQERDHFPWDEPLAQTDGWAKYNRHYWLGGGYDDFVEFFFERMFSEPHSTKQREDAERWAHQTTPQVVADTTAARLGCDGVVCASVEDVARRVRCPVLAVHGTEDHIRPAAISERLVELTGGRLVLLDGAGHGLQGRHPVKVNHLVKEFVDQVLPPPVSHPRTWTRALQRPTKVLYLSSPIGLGHARRDLAIAGELRRHHPGLQVDWLAQHPVTRVLDDAGESVHPASAALANESTHIEAESDGHDLHAFQAIRRMDEILVHNFMVFDDVVADAHYDLVVADEAWDVDYFLHENPELKRFAFAWMTDFVGWLPMPDGGEHEAALTADYNAEMIAQRARFRTLRDRSIFVGNPDDVVPEPFGPGLPTIREWTQENFEFAGYVTGFTVPGPEESARLRARLGFGPDDVVCLVTVGGSGVGASLLRRVLDAAPIARRLVPELQFVIVCGPRIDPASLPRRAGVRVLGYLPDLYRHLAACDLAVVQGGLTTCMELAAAGRPFVYVPLQHHFEQNLHVRHRLEQYGAGRHLPYAEACDPDALAAAIVAELGRDLHYREVESDGAARAAEMLAELL